MTKYQKKPVMVEAFQWKSDTTFSEYPDWFKKLVKTDKAIKYGKLLRLLILDEYHTIRSGDYIIQGVFGVIEICKPDIFEETYVKVNDTDRISPDDIGNDIHEFLHGGDK
ncbi:hypothetical protein LES9216_00040 [Leuconostoc suionicum]|uniref:Uncharacterized protein n=1 Tax=Leuconostoc suionicum TaxID=1511761 RepID=A0A2N9K6D5_9LACO|nr:MULTISPECIES: hypothetical protein [Leuconostoc]SPD94491.1 hypothetical protein LES8486_01675 [Leuconostoc suionicum]SPE06153.1 hypothetical protein LES9216_00040 [Leuconostoc suionicum]SPH04924.1 hypothetical protein LES8484_01675 [Leuconostoc suionicum]